jgi:Family of unknown function (DUF5670)
VKHLLTPRLLAPATNRNGSRRKPSPGFLLLLAKAILRGHGSLQNLLAEGVPMRFGPFLGLAMLLVVLWAGGFLFFHVAGFLIHLLLIFAVISLIVHLFTSSSRTP